MGASRARWAPRAAAALAGALLAPRPAAAAWGFPSLPPGGQWGGVLATEIPIPVNGSGGTERWDDPRSRLGRVVAFAAAAVVEHWGNCRECCDVADLRVTEVLGVTRQLATYTRDGREPLALRWRYLDGTEAEQPLVLATVWTLRLATAPGRRQHPPPATAAEHAAAAAHRRVVHDVVLHGDREGRFTVVRHTWTPAGVPGWRPAPRPRWTPAQQRWQGLPQPRERGELLLVCYNIWNFNGDWERRSGLIADALAGPTADGPDIVAFQEVRHDNGGPGDVGPERSRHQIDHLLWRIRPLGRYQHVWVPAMSYAQLDDAVSYQTEGPALFSRLPVAGADATLLTRYWPEDRGDEHQRACLAITVDTERFGRLNVLTSHLSLSDPARLNNVAEICRWARELERRTGAAATFLTGDLNMIPSDPALQFLLGRKPHRGERCDFSDVWELSRKRSHELGGKYQRDGITFNNLDEDPKKRIDFVLVRGPGAARMSFAHFEVIGSARRSPDRVPPSDHLGLRLRIAPA